MGCRTAFVVDGFNVYHSLVDASKAVGFKNETGTKWLDLYGLCKSYLPLFGSDATLAGVFYFSAYAQHLEKSKPGVVARHKHYGHVLEQTGVVCEMGRFKRKLVKCRICKKEFERHEEKETDVAVSVKVLELFANDVADRVVLVTGDTDVAPAVRLAKKLHPKSEVCFGFPWKRKQAELWKLVQPSICFTMSTAAYISHQFPDPLQILISGKSYAKPPSW